MPGSKAFELPTSHTPLTSIAELLSATRHRLAHAIAVYLNLRPISQNQQVTKSAMTNGLVLR